MRPSIDPKTTVTRSLSAALAAALLSLVPSIAHAEEVVLTEEGEASAPADATMEAGVMVRPFTGARSQRVTKAVVSAMESAGLIMIPAGFEEGVKLADAPEPYVEVARKNQIKAYIHGHVKMNKSSWHLQLQVRNGANGEVIAEPLMKAGWLPGLLKKIDADLMGVLEGPLAKTSVPGKSGDDAADVEEVTLVAEGDMNSMSDGPIEPKAAQEDGTRPPPSPLDAHLGVGVVQRTLQYNKAVGDVYEHGLQPHQFTAPSLRLGLTWYPGAHVLDGVLAHTGVMFNFYRTVGGSTAVNAGGTSNDFTTSFTEFNIGLRGRIPFRTVELGLNGGWGFQSLVLDGDNQTFAGQERGDPGVVPDAEYTYFRFGPDVGFELGLPINVGAYYRVISIADDDGYFSENRWFPEAAGIGLDAQLSVGVELTETLSLEIGGEARYYALDANSGSADSNIVEGNNAPFPGAPGLSNAVAAGASDTYFGGFISGRYTMPGVAR